MSFSSKSLLFGFGALIASALIVACGPSGESPYKKDLNRRSNTSGNPASSSAPGSASVGGFTFELGKSENKADSGMARTNKNSKEKSDLCDFASTSICVLRSDQSAEYNEQLLEELNSSLHFSSFTVSKGLKGTQVNFESLEESLKGSLRELRDQLREKGKKFNGTFNHAALILNFELPSSLPEAEKEEHLNTFSMWLDEMGYKVDVEQNNTGPEALVLLNLSEGAKDADLDQKGSLHELPLETSQETNEKAQLIVELRCHHQ